MVVILVPLSSAAHLGGRRFACPVSGAGVLAHGVVAVPRAVAGPEPVRHPAAEEAFKGGCARGPRRDVCFRDRDGVADAIVAVFEIGLHAVVVDDKATGRHGRGAG